MRAAILALALGACIANPLSSAQEYCEKINEAAVRFFVRCNRPTEVPYPNCDKVWGSPEPEESFQKCIDAIEVAPCSQQHWPEVCPKHWTRLPWN